VGEGDSPAEAHSHQAGHHGPADLFQATGGAFAVLAAGAGARRAGATNLSQSVTAAAPIWVRELWPIAKAVTSIPSTRNG